jgi:hypothetical protein
MLAYRALRDIQLIGCARKTQKPTRSVERTKCIERGQRTAHEHLLILSALNLQHPFPKICTSGKTTPSR